MTDNRYRGRFAPSPTGPLHFGSLVAALGSYLDARAQDGLWLLRMEDLDSEREVPGAADDILRTLDAFGFEWDGAVIYQSRRGDAYQALVERLLADGLAFPCGCSRKQVAAAGLTGPEGPVYPGTCRNGPRHSFKPRSIRVRTDGADIAFQDRIQGRHRQALERELGDFVIRRADGLFAYQLAVVADDAWQGINQVVRGADLLLSTPRQLHLQGLLGLPRPTYAHLPLVVDATGRKLSKQDRDLPVLRRNALDALAAAFRFLGQELPREGLGGTPEFWAWASGNWNPSRVPAHTREALPTGAR